MTAFGEQWASLSVRDPQFFPAEDDVIFVRSTVVAKAKATGIEITYPFLQMITIRDNLILEIQPYY